MFEAGEAMRLGGTEILLNTTRFEVQYVVTDLKSKKAIEGADVDVEEFFDFRNSLDVPSLRKEPYESNLYREDRQFTPMRPHLEQFTTDAKGMTARDGHLFTIATTPLGLLAGPDEKDAAYQSLDDGFDGTQDYVAKWTLHARPHARKGSERSVSFDISYEWEEKQVNGQITVSIKRNGQPLKIIYVK